MIDEIRDALAACTVLTLAYVDEHGAPAACAVFYALTPDGSPIFVSSSSTRHGRTLSAVPGGTPVAFTAQADDQTWQTLRGVQGRGICHRLTGDELSTAQAAYIARFPFITADDHLTHALAAADHYRITPTWLRLIDNSRGFAHKTEWPNPLPPPPPA
ncbi:pyridoxamine 5'-phosphate oxidase family protein [Thermopolyspora sp. NPDC052614]|uniref:pyridoxamine 5'-phosphate oxidase family protein n=1 Tax=Thermopolyspora sp. NPDC052614 TaxID=3155682 RepID=UPI003438EB70